MKRIAWLAVAPLAALAVGCSSQQQAQNYNSSVAVPQAPTPPPAYQPRVVSSRVVPTPGTTTQPYTPPPTYTPSAPPAPSYTPPAPPPAAAPSTGGSFQWASSLAEAQQIARQTGRLVLIEAGRDRCKNCQELKNSIIPSMAAELGQSVVGYYDDVDRDQGSQAFWALRNNLPNAVTLPLVGFFTPDLRWVHGFSGHTDPAKFRSDLDRARTAPRTQGALPRDAAARETAMLTSLPDAELADVGDELVADLETPAAAATPAVVETPVDAGTWAREALARAASALNDRDYDGARAILASVRERAKDAPEAREAAKGEVAIWNLRRMERDPADAPAVKERAQKDLRDTVWVSLFA
ncbi:MAG: hypothetical protein U1E39_04425 [Planctomycetota bacterium]